MGKLLRILRSGSALEISFLGLFALAVGHQLFVEPIVGLADNGDFYRVMDRAGLRYPTDNYHERYFNHVLRHYRDTGVWGGTYVSSEILLVRIAVGMDRWLTGDEVFSIRSAGAVHVTVFLIGLALVAVGTRRMSRTHRLLLFSLLFLVFTDVGYVAYCNSLYCEPASLAFLSVTLGLALILARAVAGSLRRRWMLAMAYFAAAALFVTAKPQNALGGIPLAAWGIGVMWPWRARGALLPGLLLAIGSIGYALCGQPPPMKANTLYNVVFYDLLKNSPTPEADMVALGIDRPEYRSLIGLPIYIQENPLIRSPEFQDGFYRHIGYGKIGRFYLARPARFYRLLARVAREAYVPRPDYLGNYEGGSGPVLCQTWDWWSDFKAAFIPRSILFLLGFLLLNAGVIAVKVIWADRTLDEASLSWLHGALVLSAGWQLAVSAIGEGTFEVVKHLFLFDVLFDVLLVILIVVAVGALRRGISARRA